MPLLIGEVRWGEDRTPLRPCSYGSAAALGYQLPARRCLQGHLFEAVLLRTGSWRKMQVEEGCPSLTASSPLPAHSSKLMETWHVAILPQEVYTLNLLLLWLHRSYKGWNGSNGSLPRRVQRNPTQQPCISPVVFDISLPMTRKYRKGTSCSWKVVVSRWNRRFVGPEWERGS